MYDVGDAFKNVTFTIGMGINSKTKKLSEMLLQEAIAAQKSSGEDQLRYMSVMDYKSPMWKGKSRNLVIKCEATAHSISRRVVVSSEPDVAENPEAVYREYAQRSESENATRNSSADSPAIV